MDKGQRVLACLLTVIAVMMGLSLLAQTERVAEADPADGLTGCCLESLLCTDLDPVDCVLAGGTPLGRLCGADSACGACCTSSGCFDAVTTTVCVTDIGGVYGGNASDCGGFCFPGACCLASGECLGSVTVGGCSLRGGVFQGDGTTCDDVDCGTVSCPEDLSGNSVVDVADIVLLLGAWGPCPE